MSKKQKVSIDLSNLPELTNPVYFPHYDTKSRYLVLMGGGSSGKSVFTAQKVIYRTLTQPGQRILVVRKVKADLRDSCFAELKNIIETWELDKLFEIPRGRSSELYIRCLNGNEILFYGLDDVEKRKSISGITSMWIEEASEITPEDFRQLDIRMRGKTKWYKQIILSFNPISITHWLKTEFFDQKKEDSTVIRTTYKDNIFLDEEAIKVLEGFKDVDEYYYTVYCLGEWGVTGQTVYNGKAVTNRLLEVRNLPPVARGSFVYQMQDEKIVDSSIRFVSDPKGPLIVYEMPQRGFPYVLGGDIAEGGMNFSVGQVRNNVSWNQAAVWRGQVDTDVYAHQMYCLGRIFNNALIGIEANFDTHPIKELTRLGYKNQYAREHIDKFTNISTQRFGWNTTKVTRPFAIAQHVALARDHIDTFNCPVTLDEMLTFVRDEKGKPQAQEGKQDDTILADAICLAIRDQQTREIEIAPVQKKQIPRELITEEDKPPADTYIGW